MNDNDAIRTTLPRWYLKTIIKELSWSLKSANWGDKEEDREKVKEVLEKIQWIESRTQ